MLFNSHAYPAFLLLAVAGRWLLPPRMRIGFIILTGMAFYMLHSVHSLALVLILCAIVFAALRLDRPLALGSCITLVVGVLIAFKYGALLTGDRMNLAMPIGISFFTFEFLHLLFDRRKGALPSLSARDFLAFVFFFPSLLAGPIRRFQEFMPHLSAARLKPAYAYWGIALLIGGYAQKYLLADPLIPFTRTLAHPAALPSQTSAIVGLILYSFRIYFDFAGLSNIAIGSALLLGIPLPRNFHRPYFSSDLQQFWRRWHMSLGDWVRDYIYFPLGGSRAGLMRTALNLTVTMAIVGMWHGAGWNFLCWGLWHGVGLSVRLVWSKYSPLRLGRIPGMILTFAYVTVGWAFFVTESLGDSFILFSRLFGIA